MIHRDVKPGNTPARTARELNRAAGVTAYEFSFEPRRGIVRWRETKARSVVFDQRRGGR